MKHIIQKIISDYKFGTEDKIIIEDEMAKVQYETWPNYENIRNGIIAPLQTQQDDLKKISDLISKYSTLLRQDYTYLKKYLDNQALEKFEIIDINKFQPKQLEELNLSDIERQTLGDIWFDRAQLLADAFTRSLQILYYFFNSAHLSAIDLGNIKQMIEVAKKMLSVWFKISCDLYPDNPRLKVPEFYYSIYKDKELTVMKIYAGSFNFLFESFESMAKPKSKANNNSTTKEDLHTHLNQMQSLLASAKDFHQPIKTVRVTKFAAQAQKTDTAITKTKHTKDQPSTSISPTKKKTTQDKKQNSSNQQNTSASKKQKLKTEETTGNLLVDELLRFPKHNITKLKDLATDDRINLAATKAPYKGITPLAIAVLCDKRKIQNNLDQYLHLLHILLQHHANPLAICFNGLIEYTAVSLCAAEQGNIVALEKIISFFNKEDAERICNATHQTGPYKDTSPLMWAASRKSSDHLLVISSLIYNGANINATITDPSRKDHLNWTALHFAISIINDEAVYKIFECANKYRKTIDNLDKILEFAKQREPQITINGRGSYIILLIQAQIEGKPLPQRIPTEAISGSTAQKSQEEHQSKLKRKSTASAATNNFVSNPSHSAEATKKQRSVAGSSPHTAAFFPPGTSVNPKPIRARDPIKLTIHTGEDTTSTTNNSGMNHTL